MVLWLTSHDTWTETNRGVNSFATAPICWNGKSTASKHWDLTIRFMNCNFDILGAIRRAQFQTHPTAGSCFSGAIMWSNFTSFFHFASMYFLVTFGDFWMACHGWSWFAMACQPKMGNILTTYDGYDIQAIPCLLFQDGKAILPVLPHGASGTTFRQRDASVVLFVKTGSHSGIPIQPETSRNTFRHHSPEPILDLTQIVNVPSHCLSII